MDLTRQNYLKAKAAAIAAATAGAQLSADATNVILPGDEANLKWSKAPCRFCGTGCGVMVAVRDNQVVATHGDIHAEVNRGLNCVKGYFLSKIMYGADRLTQPLLRMKDGKYAKDGEFQPVSWEPGVRRDGRAVQARAEGEGADCRRHVRLRPVDDWEGYAALKLMKAGFRTNNLDPNARHCMASAASASCARSAWMSRWAATTISRPRTRSCCGARTWRRCTRSCGPASPTGGLSNPGVKVAVMSTFEHRSFDLPTSRSCSRRRPTWRSSISSPTTSSRPAE